MRKSLILVVVLFVTIIGAALVVPGFVDWNRFKGDVETLVYNTSGREIAIAGDLEFRLLPSPRLSVQGVRLANASGFNASTFFEAERLELGVALLPLLEGRLEVKRLYLIAPRINLERLEGGQNNWSFGDEDEAEGAVPDVGIADLRIENGFIQYLDAASLQNEQLENINLSLSLPSLNGPVRVNGAASFRGVMFSVKGESGRLDKAVAPFQLQAVVGGELDLKLDGEIRKDADVTAQFQLSSADLHRLSKVLAPAIGVAELPSGDLKASADLTLSGEQITFAQLYINQGRNTAQGSADLKLGAVKTLTLNLDIVDIRGFLTDVKSSPMTSLKLRARQADSAVELQNATFGVLGGGAIDLSGRLLFTQDNAVFDGRWEVLIEDPRAILSALLPDALESFDTQALQNFTLKSALEATEEGVFLREAKGRLDGVELAGDIVFLNRARPYISAELYLGVLDLTRLLKPVEQDTSIVFPDLTALKNLDGLIALKIDQIRQEGGVAGPLTVSASLNQSELKIEQLLFGARSSHFIDVRGTVKDLGPTPRFDLSLAANGSTIAALSALSGVQAPEGFGHIGPVISNGTLAGTLKDLGLDLGLRLGALEGSARGRLKALDGVTPSYDLTLDARHQSLAALAVQFDLLDMESPGKGAPLKLNLRLRGGGDDLIAAGQISAGDAGTLSVTLDKSGLGDKAKTSLGLNAKAPKTIAFIRALGFPFDPALTEIGALDIAFGMMGEGEIFTLSKFDAGIGAMRIAGAGQVDLTPEIPRVDLSFQADLLDLNAFLSATDTGAQAAVEEGAAQRWADDPLDLSSLALVDGTVKINAKIFRARAYQVDDALLSIRSVGQALSVDDLSGKMFGGSARLSGILDGASIPRFELNMQFEDASIEAAMLAATATAPLTGRMSMNGKFSGSGISQKAIVGALQGVAEISAKNGVIKRVDIARINAQLGQLGTINDFIRLTGAALAGGQTAYRTMDVELVADQGVVVTRNFNTDIDGGADVGLDAKVSLPLWVIDGMASFRLKDHPDAPPVGLIMKGNLSDPETTYQTKALQQYMGVRLGAAVLKGVVKGEGVGLGDLIRGGQTGQNPQQKDPDAVNGAATPTDVTPDETQAPPAAKKPEEEIRDILQSIFSKKQKDPPQN